MADGTSAHEVLTAGLQVRGDCLHVLLWQRALEPFAGAWALPGGALADDEDPLTSARRQLAEKVDLRDVAHLEQLAVFGAPDRVPGVRTIASTFLGVVPVDADPALPRDTAWHPVDALPPMAFDHSAVVALACERLDAKLSYTNLGFALAPAEFTLSQLAQIYRAALGYPVDATNLQRVLTRRGVIEPTGATARPGTGGGRPAALYRYTAHELRITDESAALRPPDRGARDAGG